MAKPDSGIWVEESGDEIAKLAGLQGGSVVGVHKEGGVHGFETEGRCAGDGVWYAWRLVWEILTRDDIGNGFAEKEWTYVGIR